MWWISSSDVVSTPVIRYDVFLSFRGEDTRDNFISYLYAELRRKKIETFIDYRLKKGEEISRALQRAIEESKLYLIVFSENYASSTWCLDELTKILDCENKYKRDVIPIFYKVDPSTVRHQRMSYAEAFVKHRKRFQDSMHKVRAWEAALTKATEFSGLDSKLLRPEYRLVAEIVKHVMEKLNRSSVSDNQGIIGIEYHIVKMQSLLQLESQAIRIIGILGMGGIGKTTIASQIYKKISVKFDSSSCVFNSQEEIGRHGIQHIRSRYLSELLEDDSNTFSGLRLSDERLKLKKALLILDDVNNSRQVQDLIGGRGNFGPGSRIIVTSRDMQVLKNAQADEIYEIQEMNFEDSLKLFSLHAFKQDHPRESYMDLSVRVLNYVKGIPLALKVLGSLLHDRTKQAWESELQKLEKLPELEIFNILKVSYNGLDEEQKDIFLDIACFHRGHEVNVVAQTLDSCGFHAKIGMDVLKERCLISILEGRVVMHDLIQEMGQEIVRRECVSNPGKRSRLWKVEEIYHVLRKNKGTNSIQCIFLDICKIKKVKLDAKAFKKMDNLRMLQFYKSCGYWNESNVFLQSLLKTLPDSLKILRWDDFPQRSLPLNFFPEDLVRLEMRHCQLEKLWNCQGLPNLKRLDLSYSGNLIQIQDLSLSPNIEEIILSNCVKLTRVYSSHLLSKLNCLCLNGCVELRSVTIQSNILWRSSGLILLSNCRQLETFSISNHHLHNQPYGPEFHESEPFCYRPPYGLSHGLNHPSRQRLWSYGTSSNTFDGDDEEDDYEESTNNILYAKVLREGASSMFPSLNKHCWLDFSNCESLTSLPLEFDISMLKFLKRLHLGGCSKLEKCPEFVNTMKYLTVLILDQTAIVELPSSLCCLVGLEELSLHKCTSLEIIPSSIGNLSKLCKLDLTYCESLQTFPSTIFKLKLTSLDLHGCLMLRIFPEILENAKTFANISLTKTAIKTLPSSFDKLVGLRTLSLNMCNDLESLPNSIVNLNLLSELDCSGCGKLTEMPSDIGRLSLLKELSLHESGIVKLPESIAHLSSLKSLDLSDCKNLECIPQLPPFLKQLLAFDCPSIKRVMPNSRIQIPSNSKEGVFKFHVTNSQQLDPSAHASIMDDAWLRMNEDAYRSVIFCFPGSAVPHWFPCHSEGHSVTINSDSLSLCNDNRLIGIAVCVVFRHLDVDDTKGRHVSFRYRIKFESDDDRYTVPDYGELRNHFYWKGRERIVDKDHTLLRKYNFESTSMINFMLSHAQRYSFTFEISQYDYDFGRNPYFKSFVTIKKCGICPLYTK